MRLRFDFSDQRHLVQDGSLEQAVPVPPFAVRTGEKVLHITDSLDEVAE